jgi:hypothetical protein
LSVHYNLPITDKLLENMEVLSHAYDLEHSTLYEYFGRFWKTIHPRWNMELLSFLYNEKNKSILSNRKEYLKKALDSIFTISDESISSVYPGIMMVIMEGNFIMLMMLHWKIIVTIGMDSRVFR